jgi:CheY-like chemotaxis protein
MTSAPASYILIVDDNPQMGRLTEEVLRSQGYEVALVYDGRSALESIASRRPDLVLSDGRMPRMSGWQLCAELRRGERGARLPFVLFSAAACDDYERDWQDAGVDAYIEKPFRSAELLQLVASILRPGGVTGAVNSSVSTRN